MFSRSGARVACLGWSSSRTGCQGPRSPSHSATSGLVIPGQAGTPSHVGHHRATRTPASQQGDSGDPAVQVLRGSGRPGRSCVYDAPPDLTHTAGRCLHFGGMIRVMQHHKSGDPGDTGAGGKPNEAPSADRGTRRAKPGKRRREPGGFEPRNCTGAQEKGSVPILSSSLQADGPGVPRLYTLVVQQEMDPPVVSLKQELPFDALAWENFEKLCLRLARCRRSCHGSR